jgi:Uma2 family endonuclease
MGYEVALMPSGRESFSPDASYHKGPFPANPMRFIAGAPTFAVEVRTENDYTPSADLEMAEKRADYFLASTEVVRDVDTIAECIYSYHASDPDHPTTFNKGDSASAEPAVPGWRVDVAWIFS